MTEVIRERRFVCLIALLLILPAIFIVWQKNQRHGFPLLPGQDEEVWIIEAEIRFNALGEGVRVSLGVPDQNSPGFSIIEESFASAGFGFHLEPGEDRRGVWESQSARGPQTVYYRTQVHFRGKDRTHLPGREIVPPRGESPEVTFSSFFADAEQVAARSLIEQAQNRSLGNLSLARRLVALLNEDNPDRNFLLNDVRNGNELAELLGRMLAKVEIPAREARILPLRDGRRRQNIETYLEVFDEERHLWVLINPLTGATGFPEESFLWKSGGRSLLDLFGADNGEVRFSMIRDVRPAEILATKGFRENSSVLLDYSIYGLPVEEQNVFRKLLLIPVGAVVLVLLRNFAGLTTAGTFLPVLLALAFMETRLLAGLILFVVIVGLGLAVRSLLSWMNLLLVPRISAVVIVVILLMASLSLFSLRMDLPQGLAITFFPLIILAWTIERLSVVWEEEGGEGAMWQAAGTLVAAILCYGAMNSKNVQFLIFSFPELVLVLLALVLLMGTYTGYRLSELYRFHSLYQNKENS